MLDHISESLMMMEETSASGRSLFEKEEIGLALTLILCAYLVFNMALGLSAFAYLQTKDEALEPEQRVITKEWMMIFFTIAALTSLVGIVPLGLVTNIQINERLAIPVSTEIAEAGRNEKLEEGASPSI